MKKLLLFLFLGAVGSFLSFRYVDRIAKDQATVNQVQGVYIFIQCRPQADYAILGTVEKKGLTILGTPREMYNVIIRRAKRDYPVCEGIIFDNIAMDHATVIRFK